MEEKLTRRWTLPASKAGSDAAAAWEGAPVVGDGRLYAAITRLDGARAVTALLCYREDDPTVGPLWQRDVYESAAETADRIRPYLLTLAGPTLVYCSHAGVLVGLEAASGRRTWGVRYPARENPTSREAAPPVFAGERLYVAPADSDRIHCLDAATGAPINGPGGLQLEAGGVLGGLFATGAVDQKDGVVFANGLNWPNLATDPKAADTVKQMKELLHKGGKKAK